MAPETNADADAQTETLRDRYGALTSDDVEGREDWDPALEPQDLAPETAEDGRSFHVAVWDGGVSDVQGLADMNVYDVREGAPAVMVYLSTQGTLQAFQGTLTHDAGGDRARRIKVRNDDGVREAVTVDGQDRYEAVRNGTNRHLGTLLDVRLTRPWGALADHYELPEGVDTLYEVVEVYEDREEVVDVEPSREAANQARNAHTVAYGEEDPDALLVRERGADEEDVEDDDDDDGRTDGGEVDVEEPGTPVDSTVIKNVALNYPVDADRLADVLDDVDTSAELHALKAPIRDAARDALATQGRLDVEDVREEVEGETFRSDEFDGLVTVERVLEPTADSVMDGIVAVDVEVPEGHIETTSLGSLERVENPDTDTSGPVTRFTNQRRTCGACDREVMAEVLLDGETHRSYYTCPECGEPNVEGHDVGDDGDDVDRGDGLATDGGRPVEENRRGVAGDPTPDAEYGDVGDDPRPDALPDADADHECRHYLGPAHDTPALPDYVDHHECLVCGRWLVHDTEDDTWEVDR